MKEQSPGLDFMTGLLTFVIQSLTIDENKILFTLFEGPGPHIGLPSGNPVSFTGSGCR